MIQACDSAIRGRKKLNTYLAVDIGASSGRHIIGCFDQGKLTVQEIYRFDNGLIKKNGHLCWDIDSLFQNVVKGMKICREKGFNPLFMGIDTWGVDYVLLDENDCLLGNAVGYRDDRTAGMDKFLEEKLPFSSMYARAGIAKQPFDTVYQLMADFSENPEKRTAAKTFLMIPDYLVFLLTGVKANEYTNASTTSMLNASAKDWDPQILEDAGIPVGLFNKKPVEPGTTAGPLKKEILQQTGLDLTVLYTATHDTGSAFAAVPAMDEHSVFLSSGTWSLLGMENKKPFCDEKSLAAGFTNEGGYQGTYRYLKNIMGLWVLQCIRKENQNQYTFAEMASMAAGALSYPGRISINDNRFLAPENMTAEIKAALSEGGYAAPENLSELLACVYNSLVDCYKTSIEELELLTNSTFTSINIVGGGCNNVVLNQLLADAMDMPVYAGPTEGTAIGNLIIQMIRGGEFKSWAEARNVIRDSFEIKKYESQKQEQK